MSLSPPDCLRCPCNNCFIRKNCSKQWLKLVNKRKDFFKCRSGQAIIHTGMPLTSLYFIFQGKVKVVANGLSGKQQIKRMAKTGDILGFRGLNGNHIYSSIYAIEDSLICSIERELFIDLLKANPNLMLETLLLVTEELRKSEWRIENLMLMNVHEKIAYSLLYMHEVFGNTSGGEIDVKLKRQEIAAIARTSNEQVSRTLSDFEEEGIIKTDGKKIFLANLQELRNLTRTN
ncbi:MAG: Crp/Fnr family transcriptional regulator [Bacteroidota bacterium]